MVDDFGYYERKFNKLRVDRSHETTLRNRQKTTIKNPRVSALSASSAC